MTRSENNPWLHRFAVLTTLATLCLIGIGGLVTSNGVGMAVPDWPTTYGYNMFLFPISLWEGGIFYEHSHRLFASWVGLLTTILAVWLWLKESRAWLRWWGVAAFVLVCVQGVLGGLRVTLIKDEIGVFHAVLAQGFLVLIGLIALFTAPRLSRAIGRDAAPAGSVRAWLAAALGCIVLQLILGATMRHQHAGLAIPDFPLAYGRLWPATDPAALELANQRRVDYRDPKPITAFHIHLHMAHRLGAILTLMAVWIAVWKIRSTAGSDVLRRLAMFWGLLLVSQAFLGAATVWSNKAADVATLHVVLGALSLIAGSTVAALCLSTERLARVQPPAMGAEPWKLGTRPIGTRGLV